MEEVTADFMIEGMLPFELDFIDECVREFMARCERRGFIVTPGSESFKEVLTEDGNRALRVTLEVTPASA